MKSLPLSSIPTLDFSTQDRDYLTQQRKDFEYRLQLLSNIQPSDDFNGVREQLVKEDAAIAEEDYIQAAATNVTTGKMSTTDAAGLVKAYTSEQFSADTALEKRATDNLLEELFQDDEEMYAVYSNNPEAFQRDYDYTVNSLLVNKLYDDYQISWKDDKNKARYLTEAGTEFVTSWGASWAGFGFPLEATKQGFKINAFKDILDTDDDLLIPTALGYNLNKVITKNAKEMSPDEFNSWLTGTLKPAIDSLPMIYQTEVLESTLEGYLAGNNFFLVSDFGDWGRLGKALQKSKGTVDKNVGNFKKALDDVVTREEEALSATAKPDVTETTVLKNETEVKKDVVKDVVKEEVDSIETDDKEFAEALVKQEKIDEVSDPVNKSVVDHKSFGEENATLIGRSDGKPFATMEEAARAARDTMLKSIEDDGEGRVISLWSKQDFETASLDYMHTGEGGTAFSGGIYGTYQSPKTALNSHINYMNQFLSYLPDSVNKADFSKYSEHLKKKYGYNLARNEELEQESELVLDTIKGDFRQLRKDRTSIKKAFKTLKTRYEKELRESIEYQVLFEKNMQDGVKDPHKQTITDLLNIPGALDEGAFMHPVNKLLVLEYATKNVKDIKEPVNKYFIFKQRPDKYYIGAERVGLNNDVVKYKTLQNLYEYMLKNKFTHSDGILNPISGGEEFASIDEIEEWLLKNAYETSDGRFELELDKIEDGIVNKLLFKDKKVLDDYGDYIKEALTILRDELGFGGWWHSDINLVTNDPTDLIPFFTDVPIVKAGKVTYQRRIDNPEFLKYYAEPVKVNGKWYVKKYNGDVEFIKIEGN